MAGYIRQSTFVDGDTITAALFNNEYNQLVNAFSNTSGHKHDGTTAEGPVIGLIGDAGETSPNNKVLIDTTNNHIEFYVEVSSNPVQQIYIADGAIVPVTDSDVDLGTSSLYFKDAYIDTVTTTGNVSVGGNLTVTGTTTFNGGTITMGDAATDNVVFGADVDSHIIPDDDDTYDLGSSTQEWRNLYIDGTAHIDTLDVDANATVAGTLGVTGVLTGTSLDISGDIDVDGTTNLDVVDIDGAVDMATTLTVAGNVDFNGDLDVDGTTNLDVVDIDGAVDMATTLTVGGEITAASLDISGNVDIDGTLETDALSINSTTVTSTAAELNILDGVTSTAAELNILDGVTATAAEINLLDGVTSTTAELNILDGVTATAAEINTLDGITSTVAELNILDGVTASAADINLIDGITNGTVIASKAIVTDANKDITGGRNITISGELDAATLDISGNADIDGTLEADAITIGGVTLAETISDTVGAMVSSNTETNITVTYDDTDNTLDFVIGTLNQDTTGNAATATALETARTIGGVSFDGTSNINLPGVNTAGNQNTTGNASTATLASTVTVSDSTANTNFPVVFHNESNGLLDDTGALRYNPSTGELLVPKLTVSGTTTQVDTVTMNASNAIVFEGATADANETTLSIVDPTSDHTQYLINQGGYIPVLAAATTTQITATPAELNILDGVTSTTAELNILDGVTSTASELNLLDGSSANTVVNSKAVIYGSSGQVAGTLSTAAQPNITSLGTLTGLTVTGEIAANGGIALGDSDKATFGGEDDLQIFHTGTSSVITDTGTGDLKIRANNLLLEAFATEDDYLTAIDGGAVTIFYDGSPKLATTSTGIDVTGTITADGLTVSGDANFDSGTLFVDVSTNQVGIGTTDPSADALGSADDLVIKNAASAGLTIKSADSGNQTIALGASSDEDYGIIQGFYNSGSPFIRTSISGTEVTKVTSSGLDVTGSVTADSVVVDNITIDGNEIDVGSGNFTLDVAGDIYLDADSDGSVRFLDGGTEFAHHFLTSSNYVVQTPVSNGDIIFRGNDGGSSIDALTLDMSNAGTATFNSGAAFGGVINTTGQITQTLSGASYIRSITTATANAGFYMQNATSNWFVLNNTAGEFEIYDGTNNSVRLKIEADGDVVINEGSADADFRVESNNNTNMLFVDGGNDHVNIGSATDRGGVLNVDTVDNTATGVNISVGLDNGSASTPVALEVANIGGTTSDGVYIYNAAIGGADRSRLLVRRTGASDNQLDLQVRDGSGNMRDRMSITNSEVIFNEPSLDMDFRVESDSNTHALFVDASTNRVGILNNSPGYAFHVNGEVASSAYFRIDSSSTYAGTSLMTLKRNGNNTGDYLQMRDGSNNLFATFDEGGIIFNEIGGDTDFRVETNNRTHAIFVDGGNDGVGICNATVEYMLDVGADANAHAGGKIMRINSSGDTIFSLSRAGTSLFSMRNNATHYTALSSNNGAALMLGYGTGDAGAINDHLSFNANETVFNDGSVDRDFRVESNGNANMLFIDGGNDRVGIGTGSPQVDMHVNDSSGAELMLTRTNAATSGNLGILRFGNTDYDSNLAEIVGYQDGSNTAGGLYITTQASGAATAERLRVTSTGNLQLALGTPLQATADGRAVNVSVNTSFVTILDFSTIGGTNAGTGFYLVTVVREGASVGTSITLQVGVSSSGLVIIYDTIQANGLAAQASNAQIQVKTTSAGAVDCHATAIPMSITGTDN